MAAPDPTYAIVVEDPAKLGEPGFQVGDLYSFGSRIAPARDLQARGLSAIPMPQPAEGMVWDRTTRTFVPAPPKPTDEELWLERFEADPDYQAMSPEDQRMARFLFRHLQPPPPTRGG